MKARTDLLPCPNGSADGTNHHRGINCLAFVAMSRAKKRARSPRRFHLRFHRGNVERVNFFHGNSFHRFQYRRSSFRSSGIIVISSFY